jgi:putative ABC transport system ATP-binding protein
MTLILVTHDPSLARRCARVVRLRSGRIESEEETDEGNNKSVREAARA